MRAGNTQLMTNSTRGISPDIRIGGQNLEPVHSFKYLGSVMTDEGSKQEILLRIAHTVKTIQKEKNIALSSKIIMMRSLVISIFLPRAKHGPL